MSRESRIFRRASTTYYWSSWFFPKAVRDDVSKLYSFVRVADDFVDRLPPDRDGFFALKNSWENGTKTDNGLLNLVVGNMRFLSETYRFDPEWVSSFLNSMEADLDPPVYETLDDSLRYVYGSAEVIGLMMAKILSLPPDAAAAARLQGRAMQWINFVRDIREDRALGRCYFPRQDLKKCGLRDLAEASALQNPEVYKKCIQLQLDRYQQWQLAAEAGYKYIPKRCLAPIQTASRMYGWTARKIAADPFVVYRQKVKPAKSRVVLEAVRNLA